MISRDYNWKEFSKRISARYSETNNGYIGGDIIVKNIDNSPKFTIQKEIRRYYSASSHYNSEKLKILFFTKNNYGKFRITKRFFKLKTEGNNNILSSKLKKIKELKQLLKYPKSELIFIDNEITFKSQSLGLMKENLSEIIKSIEIISSIN